MCYTKIVYRIITADFSGYMHPERRYEYLCTVDVSTFFFYGKAEQTLTRNGSYRDITPGAGEKRSPFV